MNLYLALNPEKSNAKLLEKLEKPMIFGHLSSILPIFGHKWISSKNSTPSVVRFIISYHHAKKITTIKKNNKKNRKN